MSRLRTKHLAELHDYMQIRQFPFPVQKLLAFRLRIAEQMLEDGELPSNDIPDDLSCDCLFYRRYLLPCEHIFHFDLTYHVITSDKWDSWAHMFEESGFEIYEDRVQIEVDREIDIELTAPLHRKAKIQEITESIRERYFAFEDQIKDLNLEGPEINNAMDRWITGLQKATSDTLQQSIKRCYTKRATAK